MTRASALPPSDRDRILEELARQNDILTRERWQRIVLTCFAFALCALYTSPALMAVFAVIDIAAELVSLRLARGLDPVADPGRYRASILAVVLMEAVVTSAAGLVWLADDPYAKAMAAGLAMTTLLQLSTVRSIHLPYGIAGLATVAVIVLAFNLAHWLAMTNGLGLVVSTAAALGGLAYALTAMLSNHRLHRASAEAAAAARASDAAKSLFLAQMSHELRTPLNAIIGLGAVEATAASGASKDRLETLVTSARGLAVVLDDVLDLSAIADGRVAITPSPTDLRTALEAAVALYTPEAARTGGSLDLTLPPDLPSHVLLDGQRLRQCLSNLIGNALKHASGSAVRVAVSHRAGRLEIDVADDGPGVSPAFQPALFEPFQRGGNRVPGLGLGLAIGRSLARQMGGDLEHVPSAKGSVFRLAVAAPLTQPPEPTAMPDLTGRRILVVDDVATNRLVAASLLQAFGAQVLEADGGAEALRMVAAQPLDLILLDMAMPGMDGFETFHHLRNGPGKTLPVVAMTAGAMADQRRAALAAGMNGFLAKPLLVEALAQVLVQVLAQVPPSTLAQAPDPAPDAPKD